MINIESVLKNLYITPTVNFYSSYEELESSIKEAKIFSLFRKKPRKSVREIFTELLSKKKGLILSEPGYGKTRFLRELKKYTEKDNFTTFFIELKLYSKEKSFENFLCEQINVQKKTTFELKNDSNIIFCLDGLDETKQDSFYDVIRELKSILVKYSNALFFISCRLFFYKKFPVFKDNNITYVTIESFDFQQVSDYLTSAIDQKGKRLFSDGDIDKIIRDFEEPNGELIILIPRYLEKFVEFYLRHPLRRPSKSNLYDFFVNERLKIEDTKRGTQDGVIIRRLLEKVALIMEMYQRNDLKKDELITILEDIQSNMAGNFLNVGKLQILFDRSLWIDYGESFAFEDHTLQEYLASCELLRIGGQKFLYDIVVDRDLNEIHPSWFNTIGFVVDQNVSLLEPLIDFGRKDIERVVGSEEYNKFLIRVDTSKLSEDQKNRIFKKVFSQYQKEITWIDWDIARRLATFYDDSLNDYLKDYVNDDKLKDVSDTVKFVIKGNVVLIVGFLIRQNILNSKEKQWWKEELISYANDDNDNGVLQRHALFALEGFKDKNIIEKVQKTFNHPSDLVRDRFIDLCRETEPNCEMSLKYFIEGTKQKSIYARYGLYDITDKSSLERLLKSFIQDERFLKTFVNQESIFEDKDTEIIKHIDNCYDDDVKDKLIEIVFALVKLFENDSLLLMNIACLLKRRESNIVDIVCKRILADEEAKRLLFEFEIFLSIILTREKVDSFVEYFKNIEKADWILYRILYAAKKAQGEEGQAIYEEGRKYLETTYDEAEKREKEQAKEPSKQEKLYQEFRFKLEPEKGKYIQDLFQFFVDNYDNIRSLIKEEEIERLKKLASDLLERIDTQKQSFKVLEWDEENKGIKSFQWSSNILLFEDCIRAAKTLSLNLTRTMRKNIINFIPFAEHEGLESIFNLIGDIQESELTYVISIYNSDSERKYFRTSNFIKLVEDKRLKEAISILKSFIEDDKLTAYDRRESLRVKEMLQPEVEYLQRIFERYLEINKILAEIANGFLIENHNDQEATEWRLAQIKTRKFRFVELKGVHVVGLQESELREKIFAKPLMKLSNSIFFKKYIDLLKFSLELLKKDKEYWPYSQYIWEIVIAYIDNLKYAGKYWPIERLEEFVYKNSLEEGINWFSNRLKELKRNYQIYIGRPKSINDCIKKYNNLKVQQYLNISSPFDLYRSIKEVIDKDLRNWIEKEGAADLLYDSKGKPFSEPRIQKMIQPKLETELKLLGITTILKEPEKLDAERIDFYISYGFSPSFVIIIEIKKSNHSDLGLKMDMTQKGSFKKVKRYMEGFLANYGILLVFNVNYKISKWESFIKKIADAYTKIKSLEVIGINAIKS